jgi:hypothetical protein
MKKSPGFANLIAKQAVHRRGLEPEKQKHSDNTRV